MRSKPSDEPIRAVSPVEGELSLQAVETYRSAGQLVRGELDDVERIRRDLLSARTAPRRFPFEVAGRLLTLWNTHVLQVVGEHLLDAVAARSFGVVRAEAAARILAFFGPADRWMAQADQVAKDPSHRVEEQVRLPAEPPPWPDQTYGPYPLSTAMAAALQTIHTQGQTVLDDHLRSPVGEEPDLQRLRWLLDCAAAAIEYATEPDLDEPAWAVSTSAYLWYALRMLFHFGQVAAMPDLLDAPDATTLVSLVAHGPSTIDVWSLTDPEQRTILRSRSSARAAIETMRTADPRPAATARVQAQIDAALRRGVIVFATTRTGERLGCFHRCPWPAVYEVRSPVTIGGTRLRPMQHFTFDVVGEAYVRRGPYARRIVVSEFVRADAAIGGGSAGRRRR